MVPSAKRVFSAIKCLFTSYANTDKKQKEKDFREKKEIKDQSPEKINFDDDDKKRLNGTSILRTITFFCHQKKKRRNLHLNLCSVLIWALKEWTCLNSVFCQQMWAQVVYTIKNRNKNSTVLAFWWMLSGNDRVKSRKSCWIFLLIGDRTSFEWMCKSRHIYSDRRLHFIIIPSLPYRTNEIL